MQLHWTLISLEQKNSFWLVVEDDLWQRKTPDCREESAAGYSVPLLKGTGNEKPLWIIDSCVQGYRTRERDNEKGILQWHSDTDFHKSPVVGWWNVLFCTRGVLLCVLWQRWVFIVVGGKGMLRAQDLAREVFGTTRDNVHSGAALE